MTIDNPVVAAAMMQQTSNMLMIAPSKGNRSVPTRKYTQNIPGGGSQTISDFGKQIVPQSEMVSATPVLENAYIQKRLMQ